MKICAIKDESMQQKNIGYLFYYEKSRMFFLEISDETDEKDAPIFLSSFIKKRELSVDHEWSARWVQQRIVPSDRQNLGMILRENRLKEYDAYRLLMLGNGRCAQDDCAVVPVKKNQLPDWLIKRQKRRVTFVVALPEWKLLMTFQDGTSRKADVSDYLEKDRRKRVLLSKPDTYHAVRILPGGNGVSWGEGMFITAEELYQMSVEIPLTADELQQVVEHYILDTADVCKELQCSRQYVNQLVQKSELTVLKQSGNNRLFARGDIESIK